MGKGDRNIQHPTIFRGAALGCWMFWQKMPGSSVETVSFPPLGGRDGRRGRERSGYGGTRDWVRRRFRRGAGGRGGLAGGNEGAGDFRQICPAVDMLAGADEDHGADGRLAILGDV